MASPQKQIVVGSVGKAPAGMQMAPLPGQSNFAMMRQPKGSRGSNEFHRVVVNTKYFGGSTKASPLDNTNFNEIFIPREDKKSTGCCFRIFCPCYYLFCCCCCCEQGFKITRMRFVQRFQKWVNVVSMDQSFIINFIFSLK